MMSVGWVPHPDGSKRGGEGSPMSQYVRSVDGPPAESAVQRHLCIVGLMGVGKTTVAHLVGQSLDRPVVDSDPWIEAETGDTGREIAVRDGVDALHRLESDMLAASLARPDPTIVTPAASVIEDEGARRLLKAAAFVVWLDLDPETAFERSRTGSHRRPATLEDFRRMFRRRRPAFERVADLRLDARRPPDELAEEIVTALGSS